MITKHVHRGLTIETMNELRRQIRRAVPEDAALLSRLIRESFRDVAETFGLTPENCPRHPSNCTADWIAEDFKRGVVYYVLDFNGEACGCVALERGENDAWVLERLAVLREKRRAGYGTALVQKALTEARARGADKLIVSIVASHITLRLWYENMGFAETETRAFEHLPFLVTFLTREV